MDFTGSSGRRKDSVMYRTQEEEVTGKHNYEQFQFLSNAPVLSADIQEQLCF